MPTLDGWRAVAIILVILDHGSDSYSQFFRHVGIHLDFERIRSVGLLGVQIFFGLSGLLITSRLLAEEATTGRISLRKFYIRRVFRILPAAVTFLFVVGMFTRSGIIPITLTRWLDTLFFFANYSAAPISWYVGHFWSLAVEEHFYMLWPAAFLMLGLSGKRVRFAIVLALFVALWRALDFKFHITNAIPAVFWGRTDIEADNILWGVVVALLYSNLKWKNRMDSFLMSPLTLPTLLVFIIAETMFPQSDWKIQFALITVQAIIIPLILLSTMLNKEKVTGTLLESWPLKIIGRISFSIYLWQQLFLVWDNSVAQKIHLLQIFPINIVAATVCASLSFFLIEKPCIKIGHKLTPAR